MLVLGFALLVALVLGLRHALEPDHLAAVSTLVAAPEPTRRGAVGLAWGAGHGVALLLLAGGVLLAEELLPEQTIVACEAVVALMLILLGARSIWRALKVDPGAEWTRHRHGSLVHVHPARADGRHLHLGPWPVQVRPFLVGVVHGAAGSGALVALALAALDTWTGRMLYVLVFSIGAMAGMGVVEALASSVLGRHAGRRGLGRALMVVAGASSIAIGLSSGWPLLSGLGLR